MLINFWSCERIILSKPKASDIYQEKIQKIDWNTITMYPSMGSCDTNMKKDKRGQCFFKNLNDTLENRLKKSKIYKKQDSVTFEIFISNKGILKIKEIDTLSINNDTILKTVLQSFPKIEPAQKNDIFVNSRFEMKIKVR